MNQQFKNSITAVIVGLVIVGVAYVLWQFVANSNTSFAAMINPPPVKFVIGLVAGLSVGGFGVAWRRQQLRSYGAALIATAAFLPGAAALSTVLIFLTPWTVFGEEKYAPFWGSGIGLLVWLISAMFCLRFTDARFAIPSSYGELRQRLAQLKSQLSVLCPENTRHSDPCKSMACKQAHAQIEMIEEEFNQRGLSWALARGYINVWNRLHRAEEAMLEVAPKETVIAGALNDVLRLQGSKIDHDEDLTGRLRQAIDVIDPSANRYLQGAAASAFPLVITTPSPLEDAYTTETYSQKLAASGGTPPIQWSSSQGSTPPDGLQLAADGVLSGTPQTLTSGAASFSVRATDSANVTATKAFTLTIKTGPSPNHPPASAAAANAGAAAQGGNANQQAQARAVLRDVRCAINEFRDGRWNGLIVARNRLIATMIFTGMTAYMLLAIAIIRGVQRPAITAASTFYLVGATIGLLNQLRSASQNDTAVEDYGLTTARLITMPLFCGLAAIGGVALMAMPQMANSSSSNVAPLTITTPSNLAAGLSEQLYHQRIDASGGTPPYSWLSINGPMPEGMELKATGDLIAKVSKKTGSTKSVKFTAEVKDSTGTSVSKPFFMDITSATKESTVKQPSPQVAAVSAPNLVRSLEDIFDLHKNMIGLLLAAVFGLTPGLLFDRLQQQSEKYKTDLKSSEATQGNPQKQGQP